MPYRTTLSDDEKKMAPPAQESSAPEPPTSESSAPEPPTSEPPARAPPARAPPAREPPASEQSVLMVTALDPPMPPLMISRMISYSEEVNSVYDVAINVNTTGCEHCMELVPEM